MSVGSKKDRLLRDLVTKTKVMFTVNDFNVDNDRYESGVFTIGANKWKIGLYTKWEDEEGIQWFGIELILCKSSEDFLLAKFDSYVMDCNHNMQCNDIGTTDEYSFNTPDANAWVYYTTKRMDFIANKNMLFPNNVLTVAVDIEIYSKVNDYNKIGFDCKKFFNVKDINDFVVIVGQKKFYVSKAILCSQSEEFQALFTSNSQNNRLDIEDADEEVVEEFLKFIYFGYSDRLDQLKDQLLGISFKYKVLDLKTICENLMYIEINPKNAIQYLKAFHEYDCKAMKDKTIDFVVNNWTQINEKSSDELSSLMKSHKFDPKAHLQNEVIHTLAQRLECQEPKNMTETCLKKFTYRYFKDITN